LVSKGEILHRFVANSFEQLLAKKLTH